MVKSTILRIRTTAKRQALDITDQVNDWLSGEGRGVGVCLLLAKHTTAALTLQEFNEGTHEDLLEVFEKLVPKIKFRHAHDPSHAPDHILSSLMGASLSLPAGEGALELGTYQRVLFLELNGPRERAIALRYWN